MAEYIERDAAEKELLYAMAGTGYQSRAIDTIRFMPTAYVVEVRHRNTDDENCIICNSELDEKSAGGIWDLAGEICSIICPECDHEEQDTVYNIIRNYIESQSYCPNCGAKMDGKGDNK